MAKCPSSGDKSPDDKSAPHEWGFSAGFIRRDGVARAFMPARKWPNDFANNINSCVHTKHPRSAKREMPTPFYHLRLAQELLAGPACPPQFRAKRAEFYLGNIAPDAQTVSGQTREATHFFAVPMRDHTPASAAMFERHPELAEANHLPPEQAVFVAGYLCHLTLDQLWIATIFDPIFGEEAGWSTFPERLFLHNVLRIYLDERDRPALQNDMGLSLRQARPRGWLPFLADAALTEWGEFVARQLDDSAAARTVEVFANRMTRPRADFESLLQSPQQMQARIFNRVPPSALDEFRARGLEISREVIASYTIVRGA